MSESAVIMAASLGTPPSPAVPASQVNPPCHGKQCRTGAIYGNYHRYYGYRLGQGHEDPRMKVMEGL